MIRTLRPLARLPSNFGAGPSRPLSLARGFQTGYEKPSSGPVDLAYDVIEPKHPSGLHGDQCLVICHGLFGSKQNWRSLSKRFAQELGMPVYCLVSQPCGSYCHRARQQTMRIGCSGYLVSRDGAADIRTCGITVPRRISSRTRARRWQRISPFSFRSRASSLV